MKIAMKRVFGNTTLTLEAEADARYDEAIGTIREMEAILADAERGPDIGGEELRKRRAAIMAESGEGKAPQGGLLNPNPPLVPLPGDKSLVPGRGPETLPVDRDAHGVAWDARYHSETKNKTADGAWKIRRGLSPEDRAIAEGLRRDAA